MAKDRPITFLDVIGKTTKQQQDNMWVPREIKSISGGVEVSTISQQISLLVP